MSCDIKNLNDITKLIVPIKNGEEDFGPMPFIVIDSKKDGGDDIDSLDQFIKKYGGYDLDEFIAGGDDITISDEEDESVFGGIAAQDSLQYLLTDNLVQQEGCILNDTELYRGGSISCSQMYDDETVYNISDFLVSGSSETSKEAVQSLAKYL